MLHPSVCLVAVTGLLSLTSGRKNRGSPAKVGQFWEGRREKSLGRRGWKNHAGTSCFLLKAQRFAVIISGFSLFIQGKSKTPFQKEGCLEKNYWGRGYVSSRV
jgi:hypothetical protein